MKITYDPEVDVMRIIFSSAPIEESDEEKPGVILDFDKNGNVIETDFEKAIKEIALNKMSKSKKGQKER